MQKGLFIVFYLLFSILQVSAETVTRLNAFLNQKLPNSTVFILKNERIVYRYGGDTGAAKLQAGELNKLYLSVLVHALSDGGKISLNATLGDVLHQVPDEMSGITLKQLLNHTSGLPANSIVLSNENLSTEQAVRRIFRREKLLNEPGTAFHYSQLGYLLAVEMIEKKTGSSLESLFFEHVTRPAGMTSTFFHEREGFYRPDKIQTSLSDLLAFSALFINNGKVRTNQILLNASVLNFFTNQTGTLPYTFFSADRYPFLLEKPYSYGLWIDKLASKEMSGARLIALSGTGISIVIDECSETVLLVYDESRIKDLSGLSLELSDLVVSLMAEDCKKGITPSIVYRTDEISIPRPETTERESTITELRFRTVRDGNVTISFFDVLGNELFTLVNAPLRAGEHVYSLEMLTPGLYFYRLNTVDRNVTRKILVQ